MEDPKPKAERRRPGGLTFFWIVFALLAAFVILMALGAGRSTIAASQDDRSVAIARGAESVRVVFPCDPETVAWRFS